MKPILLQYTAFALVYNGFNLKSSTLTKEDRAVGADDRIIGGQEATPFFYNFIASIQYKGHHICGGSLVAKDWILTAAHCTIRDTNDFTVHLHRHNLLKSDASENGIVGKVVKRIVHPEYNRENNLNDIALWKISFPNTSLMKSIKDLNMDGGSLADQPGTKLTAIGWGKTQVQRGGEAADAGHVLNEVEVPVVDFKLCQEEYSVINVALKAKYQVCAGYDEGTKDTCQGDSGGPLMYINGSTAVLVGITSFGKGCALPKFPGIYTRVAHHINFINTTMRDDIQEEGVDSDGSSQTDMDQSSEEPLSEAVQPIGLPTQDQIQKLQTGKIVKNHF